MCHSFFWYLKSIRFGKRKRERERKKEGNNYNIISYIIFVAFPFFIFLCIVFHLGEKQLQKQLQFKVQKFTQESTPIARLREAIPHRISRMIFTRNISIIIKLIPPVLAFGQRLLNEWLMIVTLSLRHATVRTHVIGTSSRPSILHLYAYLDMWTYVYIPARTYAYPYVPYMYSGAQSGIIKNSLSGLSLVIDDLMRRLISSIGWTAD